MNDRDSIPCLPETAPFTAEQRAYLNGFFAGLFSRAPDPGPSNAPSGPRGARPLVPLSILFGSQTGNAESLAKRIAREAGERGFAPTVHDLGCYPGAQLADEKHLLIVTSTYGDGEPPDNAKVFWQFLAGAAAPNLSQTRYSVCALGDSNYPRFCGFGKEVDLRLEAIGAQRVFPRADCDVEFEESFAKWLDGALMALAARENSPSANSAIGQATAQACLEDYGPDPGVGLHSRKNPFAGALLTNHRLSAPDSGKDTRHFEIALDHPGIRYSPGDALGVLPSNCPGLVSEILGALHCSGDEPVAGGDGGEVPLREALLRHYEIAKIPASFLTALAERTGDELLARLTAPGVNGELKQFLWGRDILDLLLAYPAATFEPSDFVGVLKKLAARLYSIASSPKLRPGQVHLTVNVVRYESLSRKRKGVCSTFLAERLQLNATVPVFVQPNRNFRPPQNPDAPMIMVGPGTGIAPFRAFLQERRAIGGRGRSWLFFGDQHQATDFLYQDELESFLRDGTLARLDTAFSRDQVEKVYVQHRMRENARELFRWLEDGAHFYVCGDASRMARDVESALHDVVRDGGGRTEDQAIEYVARLKAEKRYQRDVY